MTEYIIRAALHDETNEGWIWTWDQRSRTVVRIIGPDGLRKIYCVTRRIDQNFLNTYNQSKQEKTRLNDEDKTSRIDIDGKKKLPTVVMGQWYRDALGGFKTTDENDIDGRVELDIKPIGRYCRWWGSLQAAAHHPDIVVRLGVRLGVLGAWLGIIGILPNFGPLIGNVCLKALPAFSIILLSGGFCVWAFWPLPPPPLKHNDH